MKRTKVVFANAAKKVAENSLKRDANCTTCGTIYQPKAPTALKNFSKINKE